MKLLVGLGNPGDRYAGTRHNIGFMVLDKLADTLNASWKSGFKGEYAIVSSSADKIYLLKPMTYMNLSGESIGELARFFKIPSDSVLVIHDELDFPFGKLKLKSGGTDGGHNGLKSATAHLGTANYDRLRMGIAGISRAEMRGYQSDYVLGQFTAEERKTLDEFIAYGAEAAEFYAKNDMKNAMNRYNKDR
ncbi:MAG: aminoacyl-tRNA hydrolase [Deferribacteraceae bacterium]|jgi:PTH1 family peptidyl-tRNA hydrolase|nr:aminoacyl-tRNA hydrolase [Deferribacteraceae bacterium]